MIYCFGGALRNLEKYLDRLGQKDLQQRVRKLMLRHQ